MTKISDLTELLGAGVDQANDLLTIVDMSETGAARNKKIKITQLLGLVTDIVGLLDFKGSTDCSTNPNYPAASKGDFYLVSVAGKIGGASGIDVTAGDAYFATADNAGGTQAGVGSSWTVIQGNITYAPVNKAGDTMTGDLIVPDEVYDATNWDGNLEVPTKNAVRDKIEALSGATFASTTEQLTGTESAKAATPDSVAALWEQGSDVASAGTISLGEGGYFNVTGTTTITDIDFATDKAGRKAWVKFAGALTLTHNSSTLILPTGANITTAAGDTACFISEGSDAVRCVAYNRASGASLSVGIQMAPATATDAQTTTADSQYIPKHGSAPSATANSANNMTVTFTVGSSQTVEVSFYCIMVRADGRQRFAVYDTSGTKIWPAFSSADGWRNQVYSLPVGESTGHAATFTAHVAVSAGTYTWQVRGDYALTVSNPTYYDRGLSVKYVP